MLNPMVRGRIRKWFSEKGFGFMVPDGASREVRDGDIFVHARSLCGHLQEFARTDTPVRDPNTGQLVNSWPEILVDTEDTDQGQRSRRTVCDTCLTAPAQPTEPAPRPPTQFVGASPKNGNSFRAFEEGPPRGGPRRKEIVGSSGGRRRRHDDFASRVHDDD